MGKFARVALRTANIDCNGRLCIVSAAAASKKILGIDRGANSGRGGTHADGSRGIAGQSLRGLEGRPKGQYSTRINDQWRICFEWPVESPVPTNVEIVDYH
jgi:RelE-like toxin of type II toxin-antitoxin system HigB